MASSSNKSADENDCSRCGRDGEAFRCYRNTFKFDIDLAREIVADGRETFELDAEDIQYSLDHCTINEQHIDHVTPSHPGIVSHIFFPDADGEVHHVHRLIDGHHRAAKCLRMGIPFHVYVLTEEESVQILYQAPAEARPGHVMSGEPASQ